MDNQLNGSFEDFKSLINVPPDIILLLDLQGKILIANEIFANSVGFPASEVIDHVVWDYFPPEAASFRKSIFEQVIQLRQPMRIEDKTAIKPPPPRLFETIIHPFLDNLGNVHKVAVIARDVTELKKAQEISKQREKRFRTLLETIPYGIHTSDLNGIITFSNPAHHQILGYKPGELVGKAIWDVQGGEKDKRRFKRYFNKILAEKPAPFPFVTRNITKNKHEIDVQVDWMYETDENGELIGLISIITDITQNKKGELALKESEVRYRTLFENVPVGLGVIDMQGKLVEANDALLTSGGYSRTDIPVGTKIFPLFYDYAELKRIQNTFDKQRKIQKEPVRFWRKDRTVYDASLSALPITINDLPYVIVMVEDISQLLLAQEKLQTAHDEMEILVQKRTAELARVNQGLKEEIAARLNAEKKIQENARRAETLARIASQISAQLNLKTVLNLVCEVTLKSIGFDSASVWLLDEDNDSLVLAAFISKTVPTEFIITNIEPLPRALYEQFVLKQGRLRIFPDIRQIGVKNWADFARQLNTSTVISIALFSGSDLIGCLNVSAHGEELLPSQDDQDFLVAISDQAAIAITNAKLFEQATQSRERLRVLSQQLVQNQELELRNLARDLHDETGQLLTSLSMNLDQIMKSPALQRDPIALNELERARELVSYLFKHVRELSSELRPSILDDLGLLPALLNLFENYTSKSGIQVHFQHDNLEERFPSNVETSAFRIIQEALTNVRRHAGVKEATIRIWTTHQALNIQIEDHGVGFALSDALTKLNSSGLTNMRERAAICGGRIEIESQPGGGTRLSAILPIQMEGEEKE